jgi:ATP-dependent DNA ligase
VFDRVTRTFLLSPASLGGRRAALLVNPAARFELAIRLRAGGIPIGELFSFVSGLYFRGKLTYSRRFATPGDAIRVITSDRGLVDPGATVTLADLRAMAGSAIGPAHAPYCAALRHGAVRLAEEMPGSHAILLGSVASDKYVTILAEIFGERLHFPTAFAGRGDMSRGGLLLRCAREARELDYAPVMTSQRHGARPSRLLVTPPRHPASADSSRRAPRGARKRTAPKAVAETSLPIAPGIEPMEAKPVTSLPRGAEWQYEPKWDGFRCLAFRDGRDVVLMSKAGKPLTRYFPEIVAALTALPRRRVVLDGELVIPTDDGLDFDLLLQRIHPAESRIRKLGAEFPAVYVLFDLLANGARSLLDKSLAIRRRELERLGAKLTPDGRIALSPATTDLAVVKRWFETVGRGLDGVIAKRLDLPYQSGERTGMQKLKHTWTADCVVGGFRYASRRREVGSLLLGLYNDAGKLDHVGFLSGLKQVDRPALTRQLERLIKPPGFTGSAPGGPSRWSTERTGEWEPLAPRLVVEVAYDHFSGGRFRHGTSLVRWRPDKAPRQCTAAQLPRQARSAYTLLR